MTRAQYKKLITIFNKSTALDGELVFESEKYAMRQISDRIWIMLKDYEEREGRT